MNINLLTFQDNKIVTEDTIDLISFGLAVKQKGRGKQNVPNKERV